jgi:hypothetical protein
MSDSDRLIELTPSMYHGYQGRGRAWEEKGEFRSLNPPSFSKLWKKVLWMLGSWRIPK